MKFTLSWLKEHLDTTATLKDITDKLTAIGLELEDLQDPSKAFEPFYVAYVEKAEKHPDADRLKVCHVNTGTKTVQVVCGAPNARQGMKGIFAPEGSYIPGTGITLKKGNIRGVDSCGMLVSEHEMGLSEDHDGIIDVTEQDPEIGTSFASLYGMDDPIIEIGLTPNRADCAGVRGIARDLAAAGLGTLKNLDSAPVKGSYKSSIKVHLDFDDKNLDACPLFVGRYIKNVHNKPSPEWLQNRLKAIGLRPISALVDITNYLSYNLCRPLHVFDADKIKGDLHLRLSQEGEAFEGLDETDYTLDKDMTVICDDSGVINLAGIMGGLESGCSDNTTNVFLEVAYFSPERTAKTGRKLGIVSDARYRFERGLDPEFTLPAAEIATKMILELCGGDPSEIYKAGDVPEWKHSIDYSPLFTKQLTGVNIDKQIQKEILENLGFSIKEGDIWQVQPPSWRGDIKGKADIVEEIIRIYGYENIETISVPKKRAITYNAETPTLTKIRKARNALTNRGLHECVSWSFMNAQIADQFGAHNNQCAKQLKIVNPINAEMDQMRPSIIPNLIQAAQKNADKGQDSSSLCEIGPVFVSQKVNGQNWVAAGVRQGTNNQRHWSSAEEGRAVDSFDAKADALSALQSCHAPTQSLQVTQDAPLWYHPGRSGAFRLGPNVLAYFGEIHPALLEDMGIKAPICGFEVFLDNIPTRKKKSGHSRPLLEMSTFQPITRDFAFIVDAKVNSSALTMAAKGVDKQLITKVEVFDVYSGKGVENDKKSIALNVMIQPRDKTLTDAEIETLSTKIIEAVCGKTGGTLR